jgi:hypothetical protein
MNLGAPNFLSFAPPSHMFWKSSIYFKLWRHDLRCEQKASSSNFARVFSHRRELSNYLLQHINSTSKYQNVGNCSSMFCKLKMMVRQKLKAKIDTIGWFSSFHDPNFFHISENLFKFEVLTI